MSEPRIDVERLTRGLLSLGVGFDQQAMVDRGVLKLVAIEGRTQHAMTEYRHNWLKQNKQQVIAAYTLPHFDAISDKAYEAGTCVHCDEPVFEYIRGFVDGAADLVPICEGHMPKGDKDGIRGFA